MLALEGKRALITGGSAGLGAAIALQLARRGVLVAINYSSNLENAQRTLDELGGPPHIAIKGDAFDHASIDRIVVEATQALGGLDIVISNVGWTTFGQFNDLRSVDEIGWIDCYRRNVLSHLWLMQACQDQLKSNKGCIVLTASVSGLKPSGSSMAYCKVPKSSTDTYICVAVSKSATIHLAKAMAIACSPEIRVNAVAAGVMLTDWSKGFSDSQLQEFKKANALAHITEVNDVAAIYVSLVENTSMTGQCIEVSSGFRLG